MRIDVGSDVSSSCWPVDKAFESGWGESIYAFWRSLYTVEYCVEGLRFHERLNLIVGPKENAAKGPS